MALRLLILCLLPVACGCTFLPEIVHKPSVHNPFPQLSKVAVAPFFNLSSEATTDGRQFALAYYNELQRVPGFEVVPIGVVESAIQSHGLKLEQPEDARRLAQLLEVDAVVVGAITDFSPYYPPRCALHVEWYAANPYFHPIPPGYGLPWGTHQEEQIPAPLVLEAEMALARAQLSTQTPPYSAASSPPPTTEELPEPEEASQAARKKESGNIIQLQGIEPISPSSKDNSGQEGVTVHSKGALPPDWPDPRGFIPPGPSPTRPRGTPTESPTPVLRHTRTYNGHDDDFTTALQSYVFFKEDARSGGWQSYLQRSDDFIRFCCHVHIYEMLTSRGGADETQVVWRWPADR